MDQRDDYADTDQPKRLPDAVFIVATIAVVLVPVVFFVLDTSRQLRK